MRLLSVKRHQAAKEDLLAGKGAWGRGAAALSPILTIMPFGGNRILFSANKIPAKRHAQLVKKVEHFFDKLMRLL